MFRIFLIGLLFFGKLTEAQTPSSTWIEVDRSIGEQKYQAALEATKVILEKAQKEKKALLQAEAMVRAAQLEMGLGSFETSVQNLRERAWPQEPEARVLLNLYYAKSLIQYAQQYRWEILRREKVDSKSTNDLKKWTLAEIAFEIRKGLDSALNQPSALEQPTGAFFKKYIENGNFPDQAKPWLRNVVIDMASGFFADTSFWTPSQAADLYRVSVKALLQNPRSQRISATDFKVHPVEMMASWFSEHREIFSRQGKKEAALEAQYELIEFLYQALVDTDSRGVILSELIKLQSNHKQNAWWSRGQALLSRFYQEQPEAVSPSRMIDSLSAAEAGAKVYPDSIGSKKCAFQVAFIRLPNYSLQGMMVDTTHRPSLVLSYKNIRKMYFRAYKVDFDSDILKFKGSQSLSQSDPSQHRKRLGQKANSSWFIDLAETKDYLNHQKLISPPIEDKGYYVIYAATREDFLGTNDQIQQVGIFVSDYVLSLRDDGNQRLEIQVLQGKNGQGVESIPVHLYRYDYNNGDASIVATAKTDKAGVALIAEPPRESNKYWNYFVVAGKDGNYSMGTGVYFSQEVELSKTARAMIFTDRGVYRPGQKIQFKMVLFEGLQADFKTFEKGRSVTVFLRDPNYQEVAQVKLKTNTFGTVAGEFVIPSGRPLGFWRLQSSVSGESSVRVEEFKRPTFEVGLLDPAQGLRLNRPAVLRGEAKYYFGQAVTSGKIRYRILRESGLVYDFFSRGFYSLSPVSTQVAQGEANLDSQGQFAIDFTPRADESLAKNDERLNFNYNVQVDLTDEGGETRSTTRNYRIGFLSLEAALSLNKKVYDIGDEVEIEARLSQLDGKLRSGAAKYQIYQVSQPENSFLPADLGREILDSPFQHEDDSKRPRFDTSFDIERVVAKWPTGALVRSGLFNHGENGQAKVFVKALKKAGIYRLQYEVQDDFGKTFRMAKDFIVGGGKGPALPLVLLSQESQISVGKTARIYVQSGFADQEVDWSIYRGPKRIQHRVLKPTSQGFIEIPITDDERGGFEIRAHVLRDYQNIELKQHISVPWDDKILRVEIASMRNKVAPGAQETVRLTVKGPKGDLLKSGGAEILAMMYDRSLDLFAPLAVSDFRSIYPVYSGTSPVRYSTGAVSSEVLWGHFDFQRTDIFLQPSGLNMYSGYGIGGLGSRSGIEMSFGAAAPKAFSKSQANYSDKASDGAPQDDRKKQEVFEKNSAKVESAASTASPVLAKPMRSNFSETAFFRPQLLLDSKGQVNFEYQVPDSLTSWKFFAQAVTKDMKSGVLGQEIQSAKDLMVRPYMPRFLREGDQAEIRVVVSNSSAKALKGQVKLQIEDSQTAQTAFADFGLKPSQLIQDFKVSAVASTTLVFNLKAPAKIKTYFLRVLAKTKGFSDGELRELPILPSRMHLVQSRFVTLKGKQSKTVEFEDLKNAGKDSSLIQEKLVATVDAQLFFGLLQALPSILQSPYQCSEAILNRYVTTGILASFYGQYPQMAKMAKSFSKRKSALEKFDDSDANRRMSMEESPWLNAAKGDFEDEELLANVLDPERTKDEQQKALIQLKKMQLASGAFPWFEGGPADESMTLYVLIGLARALEFKGEVPKDVVVRAWGFTSQWLEGVLSQMMAKNYGWEFVSTVLFALSSYPDESWTGGRFSPEFREKLMNFSFANWKKQSPRLKAYLALSLQRSKRSEDAKLVWESIMDSAKTSEELGTYWLPEDRSWLWYRDTTESQAFALRSILELSSQDPRREGFVQWLFLNKKLNQWKSTRATAEVIYSVAKYLETEKKMEEKEEIAIDMGTQVRQLIFAPDQYTGKKNQVVIEGPQVDPFKNSKIAFQNKSSNLAFASVAWHFSTEKLPQKSSGDFFNIERYYFVRENKATQGQPSQWVLRPLKSGDSVKIGDQIEVQLSLRSKHEAEYVHLRDPRAAGLEPESTVSGYHWDQGLSWYEEVRDSGSNFFMSRLPVGEATFKYRLRANMAGIFRLSPATLQSFYAPEFNAFSSGFVLKVSPESTH